MSLAKVFIQGMGQGQPVKELLEDFNIYCAELPSPEYQAKEPYKNDWMDENGDEEYIEHLELKSFNMVISVGYKGGFGTANNAIRSLVSYMVGCGKMKIYCDYNNIGFQDVRFSSCSKPTLSVSDESEGDIYKWNITLKVNDPLTAITLHK